MDQPTIYLCEYRLPGVLAPQRHAVALSRPPRPDTDEDACLPDVLAELLGRGLGVDPDSLAVTHAERVDVAGGLPHVAYVAPLVRERGIGSVLLAGPAGTSATLPADDVRALAGYVEQRDADADVAPFLYRRGQ